MQRQRKLLSILTLFISGLTYAQNDNTTQAQYLAFQTGLLFDAPYNNLNIRLMVEYQKELNSNWSYGIAYENTYFLVSPDQSEGSSENLNGSPSALTFNFYRKIRFIGDKWFWKTGLGVGALYANENIKPALTASITTYVRLSPRLYLSLPFFILPTSDRIYLTPGLNAESDYYTAFSWFPLGLSFSID